MAVFTAADVPGDNHFGPIFHDEELLAAHECHYIGQPIVALAGENARGPAPASAAGPARDGSAAGRPVDRRRDRRRALHRPDAAASRAAMPRPRSPRAEHVIEGTFRTGGQEHFYLETQAALAIPGRGRSD